MAAVELLIDHGVWLRREDFVDEFVHLREEVTGEPGMASVEWRAAIMALEAGRLPCASGEAAVLRIAASIAEGLPVDLGDAVSCLDAHTLGLFARAVLTAGGAGDAAAGSSGVGSR